MTSKGYSGLISDFFGVKINGCVIWRSLNSCIQRIVFEAFYCMHSSILKKLRTTKTGEGSAFPKFPTLYYSKMNCMLGRDKFACSNVSILRILVVILVIFEMLNV
jgi:hypothetical protein